MLLVIAIIIGIPVLLCFIYSKNIEDDLKVGVPGPKGWPLIGSLLEIRPSIKNLKIHQKFHDFHEMYGDTFQIRIGPNKMIVSRDPKMIEAIVNNPKFGKSSEYKLLKDWAGENILTNNGEKWQKMRKLMTPAFHFQILERFVPIFEEKTNIMIEIIKEQSSKSIDVSSLFNNLTLDVISETSMGVSLNSQIDSQSPFIQANEKVFHIVQSRLFNGFLTFDWIFRLSPLYKVHQECISLVNKVVDKVIEERRGKLLKEKENNNLNENAETSTKKRPALLDILLEAQIDGDPLTNENIRNEVKVFMFAGHETTAGTLSFISYLIAKHPEVQQKLFDEIKINSLDKNINSLKIRDLNALSYMDNVIKETLRIFPPAFMALKSCKEDIKIGDVFIPAGTTVGSSIYSSHRNEKYFKNPEEFNPDRFGTEMTAEDRNPYVFQPFSSGLRNCIGQKFALLEMKTILVKMLSSFELNLATKDFEVDEIVSGTLKSRHGFPIIFKLRS